MSPRSILSRYLDPDVLSAIGDRRLEPHGLVMGNLAGAHKSPLHGFAVEFAGHREYVPGDDPRHIDWRVYFTREKYFIKQYEMETNLVCHLVLDASASMRYGEDDEQKLAFASRAVACLGYAIVHQSDKVSLATFDDRVRGVVRPSNSMGQVLRMARHLDELEPVEKTRMADCLNELIAQMGRREIIMIFSDFFTNLDELEPVLQRMRYNGHEVVLFHVLHRHEIDFDFTGMVKFIGLEDPDEYLTQPDDIRARYLDAFRAYIGRFDDICRRNRVERVAIDTSRNLGEALLNYLNERAHVRAGR